MSQQIIDSLALVAIEPRSWGGTVTLNRDLLPDKGQALLPTNLVKKEQLLLINPRRLNCFDAFRKSVERQIAHLGFRLFSLRAIPRSQANDVQDLLNGFKPEFEQKVRAVVRNELVRWYDEWERDAPPELQPVLHESRLDVAEVLDRFRFSARMMLISPPTSDPSDPACRAFFQELGEAVGSLLRSVADEADEIWKSSLRGKTQIQQATLRPVKRLFEKLRGFTAMDARLQRAVTTLESTFAHLPKTGRLSDTETALVFGVVRLLADPAKLLDHGTALVASGPVPVAPGALLPPRGHQVHAPRTTTTPATQTALFPPAASTPLQPMLKRRPT